MSIEQIYLKMKLEEGKVIQHAFQSRQDQKGKTPYYKNPDIEVPQHDPMLNRPWNQAYSKNNPQEPYEKFETEEPKPNVSHIIGITKEGNRVRISTAPTELATVLSNAYNRNGFTDVKLEKIPLGEGFVKNTLIGAAMASASLMHGNTAKIQDEPPKVAFNAQHSIDNIVKRYKIDPVKAKHIVDTAIKYQKYPFPMAHHILGTIGVESSFNENAKSKLKHDAAIGLMQIRPKSTGIHPKEVSDIEGQIKHGSYMLHDLYKRTGGDEEKAIQAYNIGMTSYNKGKRALAYLEKTKKETQEHIAPKED